MEISYLGMYLFTRVDCFINLFVVISILCYVFFGVSVIVYAFSFDNERGNEHQWLRDKIKLYIKNKFFIFIFILSVLVKMLVPTQKEIAAIYVVPKIANSAFVNELPKELNNLVMEWIEELKPTKTVEIKSK